MGVVWKKFKLLLWKNYTLQKRHKIATIVEVCVPLLFTLILILIRGILNFTNFPNDSKYPAFNPEDPDAPVYTGGIGRKVLYSPDSKPTSDMMNTLGFVFKVIHKDFEFKGYGTEKELLDDYINLNKNTTEEDDPVLAAIVFRENRDITKDDIQYVIRYPASLHDNSTGNSESLGLKPRWLTEFLYELFQLPRDRARAQSDDPDYFTKIHNERGGAPGYWREGFLFLQACLDKAIIKFKAGELNKSPDAADAFTVQLKRYPYPPYTEDVFIIVLQIYFPLFVMLSFIYSVINISKSVAHEKEKRLKEAMKIMGLPNWLHWTAWFVKCFIFLIISALILTLFYKIPWYKDGDKGVAILTNSDPTLMFVFFLLYVIATIMFGFMVAAFFSTANAASTACGVVFFLSYFPFFFLRPRYKQLDKGTKIGWSLFSNTAMAFGGQIIAMFEGTGAGAQWGTIASLASPDDDITLLDILIMLIFDSIFYLFIAIYLEAIFPGTYGVALPWYYPFTKWYWLGTPRTTFQDPEPNQVSPDPNQASPDLNEPKTDPSQVKSDAKPVKSASNQVTPDQKSVKTVAPSGKSELQTSSNFFQKEPKGHAGIQIKGLTKKFGKKVAVNELSLNFYENQVTALLGHNGAGKTTTMSMLTGIYTPTSGTAIVNGYDIRTDIQKVRSSLGLCPQHDVLFDELTVQEHLEFFCLLKGVSQEFVQTEIDRMLGVILLEPKRHSQSNTLSGGMKRKLSVGIALIGGSKVVLLDEPTSGMDPSARRSTWDLITNEKKGRTIVLSTHFMDEADLLGDRIAILADGRAQCCGSSLFLKKKYGGGYHLIIVKLPKCQVDKITQIIQKGIPEADVDQNIGAELSYTLPDDKASSFPQVFEELEKKKNELGIASYGCSITEMEEVFMKVGEQVEAEMNAKNPNHHKTKKRESQAITAGRHGKKPTDPKEGDEKAPLSAKPSKNSALGQKLENVDAASITSSPGGSTLTTSSVKPGQFRIEMGNEEGKGLNEGCRLFCQQFRAMLVKKCVYAWRNKALIVLQCFIPVIFLFAAILMLKTLPDIATPKERKIDLGEYVQLGKPVTPVQCDKPDEGICKAFRTVAEKKSTIELVKDQDLEDYILEKSRESLPHVNYKYVASFKTSHDDMMLFGLFNNQPFHIPPLILNLIMNAILVHVTGNDKLSLSVANHPLPFTGRDTAENLAETENEGFAVGFNVSFGMSIFAASFVVFVIKEKEINSKHLQFVSGVRFPVFWLAHFLFDYVNYLFAVVLLVITLVAFQLKDFGNSEIQGYFCAILLVFGWAIIPLMYVFSFLFHVPSTGYLRMSFFNLLTGMATIITMAILSLESLDLLHIAESLEWLFMFFPIFDVGRCMTLLTINQQLNELCPNMTNLKEICEFKPNFACCGSDKWPRPIAAWNAPGIGRHLFFLFIVGLVSFIIIFLIESKIIKKVKYIVETKIHAGKKPVEESDQGQEDGDVAAENRRIRETELSELFQTENMILQDLTKVYGHTFLAVNKVCLGVKNGECFGLLGINGAGKTTTFKMLTGDIGITSGQAYIANKSVRKQIRKVQKVLGYCPQFDALIPELTGRQTIRLFSRLRGIPEDQIDKLVDVLGKDLLFTQHMEKPCGTYSGGNRRKLSVALALVGNPPIVFLDEPTTGMDPVARRHLWNTIIRVREGGASVILTSHSMEECEALCTRLAIMVNGKFHCLGSTQHLKNKFGDGYTVIAQLDTSKEESSRPKAGSLELGRRLSALGKTQQWELDLEPLQAFIMDSFPGCQLKEKHPSYVHYHVKDEDGVSWGKIFKKMEEAKGKFKLDAYSVGQTTLEQVFLGFTKKQATKDN